MTPSGTPGSFLRCCVAGSRTSISSPSTRFPTRPIGSPTAKASGSSRVSYALAASTSPFVTRGAVRARRPAASFAHAPSPRAPSPDRRPLRPDLRLQLPRVARRLLPGPARRLGHARLLRRPPERRRAERKLLPDPAAGHAGRLDRDGFTALPLLLQSAPGSHLLGGRVRSRGAGPRGRPAPRRPGLAARSRSGAVPAPSAPGPRPARTPPRS